MDLFNLTCYSFAEDHEGGSNRTSVNLMELYIKAKSYTPSVEKVSVVRLYDDDYLHFEGMAYGDIQGSKLLIHVMYAWPRKKGGLHIEQYSHSLAVEDVQAWIKQVVSSL